MTGTGNSTAVESGSSRPTTAMLPSDAVFPSPPAKDGDGGADVGSGEYSGSALPMSTFTRRMTPMHFSGSSSAHLDDNVFFMRKQIVDQVCILYSPCPQVSALFLVCGSRHRYRFLPDGAFLPCDYTGWIFDISLCEHSVNQS